MSMIEIFAMICILAAIACFIVETVRSGFNLLAFGLVLLSTFFLLAVAIPSFQS